MRWYPPIYDEVLTSLNSMTTDDDTESGCCPYTYFFHSRGGLLNGGSDRAQTFRVDGWGPQRMGFYKGGPRIHQNGLRRTVFEIGPLLDFQRFLDAKGAAPGDWGVTKHYGNGYSRVLLPFATGFKALGPLGAKIFDFWRRVPHVTAPYGRTRSSRRVSTLRKIPANRDTLKNSGQPRHSVEIPSSLGLSRFGSRSDLENFSECHMRGDFGWKNTSAPLKLIWGM